MEKINNEIEDYKTIYEEMKEKWESSNRTRDMLLMCPDITEEEKQEQTLLYNSFKCKVALLAHEIKFLTQYKTGEMEANMLTKMNELIMESLQADWDYIGQENIKEDSELAIDSYEYYKDLFNEHHPSGSHHNCR